MMEFWNNGTQINTDKHGLSRRHRERGGYILTGFAGFTRSPEAGKPLAGSRDSRGAERGMLAQNRHGV
jgi:hypothetical protein